MLEAMALSAVVGLAGCLGSSARAAADCKELPSEPDYKGWFDGVNTYHGTCDARGRDLVTIEVGSKGSHGGNWGFNPEAVAVTPGTTVRWVWNGKGGAHDVVAESGAFESGKPTDEKGTTFEHTFDDPSLYKYYCTPHKEMGMKGAVFVALE